jgi:hypothetical protein
MIKSAITAGMPMFGAVVSGVASAAPLGPAIDRRGSRGRRLAR